MLLISIITPCFNDEHYLSELVKSLAEIQDDYRFEHIIVNDGSNKKETITFLQLLTDKGYKVVNQPNMGLGAARNLGVKAAQGKYILPVDTDNRINVPVFLKAAEYLEQHSEYAVCYTDAQYFGEKNGNWVVGNFNFKKLLQNNYIDACALIRKDVLIKSGGYNTKMPHMGHEDWEFWVRIHIRGFKFLYLPEIGFYYRVTKTSMIHNLSQKNYYINKRYIYECHHLLDFLSESKQVDFDHKELLFNTKRLFLSELPIISRFIKAISFIPSYMSFNNGWKKFIKDCLKIDYKL